MHTTAPKFMYEIIEEQCELAVVYAKDGAYASAARVLRKIALETLEHAHRVHGEEIALKAMEP